MRSKLSGLLLGGLLLLPSLALAQAGATAVPPASNLQNPGARALSLGGAVVGLADDASASELNPAGITQIPRDEVSVEFRQRRLVLDNRYVNSQPFAGTNPREGNVECFYAGAGAGGTCGNLDRGTNRGLAFASAVIHTPRVLSLALYRHEIDRQRIDFLRDSLSVRNPEKPLPARLQFAGTLASFDRKVDRTGLAVGLKFSPRFSLGFSLNENSLNYSYVGANEYQVDGTTDLTLIETGNQKKFGYTGGLIWTPTPTLQFGAAYSSKVRFRVSDTLFVCLNLECPGPREPGYGLGDNILGPNYIFGREDLDFTLPPKYGAGFAIRPARFNIVGEVDRVLYSRNNRSLRTLSPIFAAGKVVDTQVRIQDFQVDDIYEIHAGIEWLPFVSPAGTAFAIRAGYFREPDHIFRPGACVTFKESKGPGSATACPNDPLTQYYKASTVKKHDSNHVTGGVGFVWAWGQIDIGYDRDTHLHQDIFSASLVIRP